MPTILKQLVQSPLTNIPNGMLYSSCPQSSLNVIVPPLLNIKELDETFRSFTFGMVPFPLTCINRRFDWTLVQWVGLIFTSAHEHSYLPERNVSFHINLRSLLSWPLRSLITSVQTTKHFETCSLFSSVYCNYIGKGCVTPSYHSQSPDMPSALASFNQLLSILCNTASNQWYIFPAPVVNSTAWAGFFCAHKLCNTLFVLPD